MQRVAHPNVRMDRQPNNVKSKSAALNTVALLDNCELHSRPI